MAVAALVAACQRSRRISLSLDNHDAGAQHVDRGVGGAHRCRASRSSLFEAPILYPEHHSLAFFGAHVRAVASWARRCSGRALAGDWSTTC